MDVVLLPLQWLLVTRRTIESILFSLSQILRMVWVERDFKDHLIQPPCHGQGHLPLDHIT